MKYPLDMCVIAVCGDFGEARSWDKMKQWIETNGGKATRAISARVTHLVCSRLAWKNQGSVVQAALKHDHIKIVEYNWLEDSLLHPSRTRRAVAPYLWSKLEKDIKTRKVDEKQERQKKLREATYFSTDTTCDGEVRSFKAGCELAKKDLQSDNHHLYRDDTGFVYNIILNRPDIARNRNERYRLCLYESNIHPPFLYACTVTYTAPGSPSRSHILAERGSQFDAAFAAWRKFFKSKTGVDWDHRFHGQQTQLLRSKEKMELYNMGSCEPIGTVSELTLGQKDEGKHKAYFSYTLPDKEYGQPSGEVGLMDQAIAKYGMPPKDLWQVGGEASDDELEQD